MIVNKGGSLTPKVVDTRNLVQLTQVASNYEVEWASVLYNDIAFLSVDLYV